NQDIKLQKFVIQLQDNVDYFVKFNILKLVWMLYQDIALCQLMSKDLNLQIKLINIYYLLLNLMKPLLLRYKVKKLIRVKENFSLIGIRIQNNFLYNSFSKMIDLECILREFHQE